MRLSKLKLAGFKSFVDPTTVLTPGQLVGIVGPNGCGKSNLIDAVRWVLGESRAAALRGESMQDVIFNGSTTRKPVSRASVELIFDNADGKAAGQWSQYGEIAVKRVVERSGESEYFINNVRVRRKDVIDLFLGTGLGPRAYAIIEQGMISRVIEARPEEVRGFLEEAAGITKYKERRRETEGRLADARDNLARLEDICAELGQQILRLSGQAEVAQRHQSLSANLRNRQSLLWTLKLREAQTAGQQATTELAEAGRALEASHEAMRQLDNRLAMTREQHARMAESVGQAQGDVYEIAAEVSRIESEQRSLRERQEALASRIEQLSLSQAQWQSRAQSLSAEQSQWRQQRESALARQAAARAAHDGTQARQPEAQQKLRAGRESLDGLRQQLSQAEQQCHVAQAQQSAAERALTGLQERRDRLSREQEGLITPAEESLPRAHAAVEAAEAQRARIEDAVQAAEAALLDAQNAANDAKEASAQAAKKLTEIEARLNALSLLQSRLRDEGELADWLKSTGLAEQDPAWQHLSVDPGLEFALEAILRERLGARGPLDSAGLIRAMKNPAPASMVLLRQGTLSSSGQATIPEGCKALRSLVRSDSIALSNALDVWLANVALVDDLSDWLTRELPQQLTLVSRNGAILRAGELVLFAPDARTHGALERQREIAALQAARQGAQSAVQASEQDEQTAQSSVQSRQASRDDLRGQLTQAQQSLHAAQLDLVRQQQTQARHDERVAQLAIESEDIRVGMEVESRRAEEARQALSEHQLRANTLRVELSGAEAAVAEAEKGEAETRETAARDLRSLQEAEFAVRECDAKLGEIARNDALVQEESKRAAAALAEAQAELASLDDQSLATSMQTALQLREAREAELTRRRDALEGLALSLRMLDEERMRAEQGMEPLRERQSAARLAQQTSEMVIAQANERLAEIHVDPEQISLESLQGLKETSLTREVSRLQREIEELGPVNLAALEELDKTSERKRFLDEQYADLMQAIDTLESAIRRIDRETREQLSATYNTVNRHFGELFPQLFGGGEASLVLTGDEILDSGIQIVAQPPGKKNTSIHLLSGGEKALTAIALVFAMFQLNPAPFCMLDEVDAPLDDTNTERYCEMVKRMSSVTQFVFISHSKITMERAQQLVGVTMQEQGVSRVVEVDIEEALKLAEPAEA